MPESLTDEQILDIQDDAPAPSTEVAEAPDATSPIESPAKESAGEPTQPETRSTPQTETAKKELAGKTAAQESSGPLSELFPGGETQAKETIAKSGELDAIDAALHSGDHAGMAEVALNAYQEGPEAYPQLLSMGLDVLKQNSPEQHAQLIASLVSKELGGHDLWRALEHIYATSQQRPEEVPALLDRLAGFFTRYGLGPSESATESASWRDFTAAADEAIRNFVDADIRRELGAEFNAVTKQNAKELLEIIHAEIQEAGKQDHNLGLAFANALRGGLTQQSGVAAVNLVASKLRAIVPGVVRRVREQFPLSKLGTPLASTRQITTPAQPKVVAKPEQEIPRSLAEAWARGLSRREILKLAEGERRAADAEAPLGLDEARGMSDHDILYSTRPGDLTRASRQPQKISRAEAKQLRTPFRELLDDALEITE